MKEIDLYTKAHLVVAAIRILEHNDTVSSSIEKVCEMISFSLEHGNLICKKLDEMGIIELVEGAYGTMLFVKNHLKIEEIPRGIVESKLEEELKKFQSSKKDLSKKIELFQTEQAEKQKNLFAELEKKLKNQ
jgi:DNA-binding IscR family transcriptional regulator